MDYKYPEQTKTRRRFWTEQEDNILAHGIRNNKSYKQISKLVNRSEAACTQRAFHLRESFSKNNAVARKVSVEPKPVPAKPKAPEVPDLMLDRVLNAERTIQQIPTLTLISGASTIISFTTMMIVIFAVYA